MPDGLIFFGSDKAVQLRSLIGHVPCRLSQLLLPAGIWHEEDDERRAENDSDSGELQIPVFEGDVKEVAGCGCVYRLVDLPGVLLPLPVTLLFHLRSDFLSLTLYMSLSISFSFVVAFDFLFFFCSLMALLLFVSLCT